MRGNLAAQRAKEKFTDQVEELELQEVQAETNRKLQEVQAEAKHEMERKQMQNRLNKLREGSEKAGMEAELSVLEEGEGVSPTSDPLNGNSENGQVGNRNELSANESRQSEDGWTVEPGYVSAWTKLLSPWDNIGKYWRLEFSRHWIPPFTSARL